jgi:hypothetical protein
MAGQDVRGSSPKTSNRNLKPTVNAILAGQITLFGLEPAWLGLGYVGGNKTVNRRKKYRFAGSQLRSRPRF